MPVVDKVGGGISIWLKDNYISVETFKMKGEAYVKSPSIYF